MGIFSECLSNCFKGSASNIYILYVDKGSKLFIFKGAREAISRSLAHGTLLVLSVLKMPIDYLGSKAKSIHPYFSVMASSNDQSLLILK